MKLLSIIILFIMSHHSYTQNNQWETFQLEKLSIKRVKTNRPWLQFIDKPSMRMGLYELPAGGTDDQTPHLEDEVYYVVEGSGTLEVADDTYAASPGSLIYVKAQIPHRFVDIKEDMKVLVIFSKTPFDVNDMDWKAWEMKGVLTKKPNENEWNPFLTVSTLQWGIYMLPQKLGGDETLTHKVDEINIVVDGKAKFKMGDDILDVKPGSIIWVKEGVGHYFYDLDRDFKVLILFEKKK
jgi:mannose-6-phosphate isomerase-like protein (cupin superfamily)